MDSKTEIAELKAEKADLAKFLQERLETLRRFAAERREVELSMGDGLLKLTSELENERSRTREASARADGKNAEIETLKIRLADLERAVADRDERVRRLAGERDEIMRTFVAESEKVVRAIEERRAADAAAESRLAEQRKRLEEESERRAVAEGAAADARRQMSALAEQTARSLQERDTVVARFSDWEKERQRLLDDLRQKDDMLSMLSSAFQGNLKKAA